MRTLNELVRKQVGNKHLLFQHSLCELKITRPRIDEPERASSHAKHDDFAVVSSAEAERKLFDIVQFEVDCLGRRLNTNDVFVRISGGTNAEELFWKCNTGARLAGKVANCAADVAIFIVDGEEDAPDGA